ncbi:hypothetical protein OO25_09195 [Phaeobacter sp. S60]|nr:hypothetical protein OO25_09195 [Phaeobacter sp. S60]
MFVNRAAIVTYRQDRHALGVAATAGHKGIDRFKAMGAPLVGQRRKCTIHGRRRDIRFSYLKLLKNLIRGHRLIACFQHAQYIQLPSSSTLSHIKAPSLCGLLFYNVTKLKM